MKKFSDNNMSDEQLQELLRKLKLVFFADNLICLVSAAAKIQVSCFNFLAVLAEGELAARSLRGFARRRQASKISVLYSMDSVDWSFPTRINRPQIEQLMRLEFMQNKGSVVIIGPVGVGKTRIAA